MATNNIKLSPKDFFLWLGAMVALYVSAFSLLALLFEVIGVVFPDTQQGYVDPFNSGMRFAIAALVVFYPLYIFLTWVLNNDIRAHHEKSDLGIRKWLILLTLFVTGLTIAGDLVTLINTFLGGEVTVRFILKVIAVFVVAGGIFAYYLYDLMGAWEKNKKRAVSIAWGVSVLVTLSVVGAFFIVGSPTSQRALRFDQERVANLQEVQSALINYWQGKQALPQSLGELNDPLQGFVLPTDPVTGEQYGYTVTASTTFELCASFDQPSPKSDLRTYAAPMGIKNGDVWLHGTGLVCFERTIDPAFFPPYDTRNGAPTPKGMIVPQPVSVQ